MAAVLVVGFVLWLVLAGGDDQADKPNSSPQAQVKPLSQSGLVDVTQSRGKRVYWVGPRTGVGYEFTTTPAGRAFVRYLPEGVRVGDPRPAFLTVATYPLSDPVAAVRRAGRKPGAKTVRVPSGGVAVTNTARPTSAFFARPGAEAQVEVYDPKPGQAMKLVLAGRVQPVR